MKRWPSSILALLVLSCPLGPDRNLPEAYRHIAVPNDVLDSPDAIGRGRVLFAKNCALCHGDRGDGKGARATNLSSPARDFTNSEWRSSVSPRSTYVSIREGVRGTAMPSWKSLSEAETWELVAYVLSLSQATITNLDLTGLRDPSHRDSAQATPIMIMAPSRSSSRAKETV